MTEMSQPMARQCAEFLRHLRRTANIDGSAAAAGITRSAVQSRRKRFPDFATQCDAALAYARARLTKHGATLPAADQAITQGGEYTVSGSGRRPIQVRRAAPNRLSAAGERQFLDALAATANVRLSAELVGVTHTAIYARRARCRAFDEQMRLALAAGYDRLECALLENGIRGLTDAGVDLSDWGKAAAAEPAPLERMTIDQALRLMDVHRRSTREDVRRTAHNTHRVTSEETDAALIKALDSLAKREARKAKRKGGKG